MDTGNVRENYESKMKLNGVSNQAKQQEWTQGSREHRMDVV
jgi:hypothetical protein